jgi:hypothetical protein
VGKGGNADIKKAASVERSRLVYLRTKSGFLRRFTHRSGFGTAPAPPPTEINGKIGEGRIHDFFYFVKMAVEHHETTAHSIAFYSAVKREIRAANVGTCGKNPAISPPT